MKVRPLATFGGAALGMVVLLGALGAALAQDAPQGDQTQMIEQLGEGSDEAGSPPGRVAQLSYAEGSVSLEPAGTSTWTSATLNRPLTLGDKLWVDQNSRAELDLGDAVIRLGNATGFSFLNLDSQTAQMQVTAGTVIVHVRSLATGEQDEIDTPNLALTLQQPGTYRIEVSDTGDATIVKVDDGEALATGGGQSYPVTAQQSVTFTGTTMLAADYASLGAPDSLDDWSMQRDQQEQQQASVAQQYVPPQTVGAEDLGSYGTWESTPDWGYAWFPAVSAGWAPYSLGSWVWVSPWGWTWVDAEPWGFAPFHYGRWGYWHHRWCWVPGPRRKRAIYSPAMVGWVGGARAGASVSMRDRVGWFPLSPRDVYVPHGRRVGLMRYSNREIPGAVTTVPRNVFTSAQPVGPHRLILPHQTVVSLRPTTAAPAIAPVRQSVLGIHAGRVVREPPRRLVDRPVVARIAPPRAPVSFARERAAIRANGGRPLRAQELARLRPNLPAAPVRLARPPVRGGQAIELRTAPQNHGAPTGADMSARARMLQQPTLPPARTPRNDRPVWAQQRPMRSQAPMDRQHPERLAPPQRQAPLEWRTPPQRQIAPQRQGSEQRFAPQPREAPVQRFAPSHQPAPAERFAPAPRQAPVQRFAPQPREAPVQRFAPPPQDAAAQRFAPPPRQIHFRAPEQRSAAPQRQVPEQRFAPPAREMPQQRPTSPGFSRPSMPARAPMSRAAPARAPEHPPRSSDRK